MSKAVYVMDMPKNGCMDCDACRDSLFKTICGITGNGVSGNRERGGFPNDCPLKPMPEKRKRTDYLDTNFRHPAFDDGWNACVDEICGEEQEDEKRDN